MDWNTILFAAKWVIIGIFYFVLLLLLFGVYREISPHLGQGEPTGAVTYGRLRVVQPGKDPRHRAGMVFNLKAETRLGAEADNDIVLGDPFVSGHHARLSWDGVGWRLEDLNSKNGTRIGSQPLAPGHPQPIPEGAAITIGDMVFELLE